MGDYSGRCLTFNEPQKSFFRIIYGWKKNVELTFFLQIIVLRTLRNLTINFPFKTLVYDIIDKLIILITNYWFYIKSRSIQTWRKTPPPKRNTYKKIRYWLKNCKVMSAFERFTYQKYLWFTTLLFLFSFYCSHSFIQKSNNYLINW